MSVQDRQTKLKSRIAASNDLESQQGFIAHFVTSGRISVIDDWLGLNVKGRWTIRVEGSDDERGTKKYAIRFADKADCILFRERFTVRKPS